MGVEVLGEPLDPELLEADAAPEHEVDVELAARERAGLGEVPGGELLVSKGYERARPISELPVCKRCAKKVAA